MTFGIWHRVLQSRAAMHQTLAWLLRSADLTFVATASELGGQEVETESVMAFYLDKEGIRWNRKQYWEHEEMDKQSIYPLRGSSSEDILVLRDWPGFVAKCTVEHLRKKISDVS